MLGRDVITRAHNLAAVVIWVGSCVSRDLYFNYAVSQSSARHRSFQHMARLTLDSRGRHGLVEAAEA
jgi:hypothetical protein